MSARGKSTGWLGRHLALAAITTATTACTSCSALPGVPTSEERQPLAVARAAEDLHCTKDFLAARYVGDRLFRVSGCGQRATYRVICKIGLASCYLIGGPDHSPEPEK